MKKVKYSEKIIYDNNYLHRKYEGSILKCMVEQAGEDWRATRRIRKLKTADGYVDTYCKTSVRLFFRSLFN